MLGSYGCLDFALVLNAVALFGLAVVCFTADDDFDRRFPLFWLGWAAVFSGAFSCAELLSMSHPFGSANMARGGALLGGTVCLVEYWSGCRERRGLPRASVWGYFAMLGSYGLAVALDPVAPFRWTGVLFVALGAVLTAWYFLVESLIPGRERGALLLAAAAVLGAGTFGAMKVSIPQAQTVLESATLNPGPIPLLWLLFLRAGCAALLGCSLWWLSTLERRRFTLSRLLRVLWLPAALSMLLLVGWGMAEGEGRHADSAQRDELMYRSRLVAAALDREMLSWLAWTSSDAGRVVYMNLRRRLTQVVQSDDAVSQALLYLLRDGKIICGAASAAPEGERSPGPGEVLGDNPSARDLEFWRTGEAYVEGPVQGPAGLSVTAHVPVTRRDGGEALSALSMNIEARNWYKRIATARQTPLRMTLLTALLILGLFGLSRLRLRHEVQTRASERRYRSLFESMFEGVAYCHIVEDDDGQARDFTIQDMNPAAESLLGKPREALVGRTALDVFPELKDELKKWIDFFGTVSRTGRTRSSELYYQAQDRWFTIRGFSWKPGSFAISFYDITEQRKTEREHRRLALLDPLTELPNRRLFRDRLDQALARADRSGMKCAVLYLDLNDFKAVNDNFGHAFGDVVLTEVADRLRECMRRSDTLARIGGDEFVAVVPEIKDINEVAVVAGKIKHVMSRPFRFGERVAMVGVSIGVSIYPDHGTDAGTILLRADAAMYSGKGDKTRQFVVYEG